ncbi:MAG: FprA family A-type flavoprotein [Candidatus Acetothermia bacterium]
MEIKIEDSLFWVGVNDRKNELFESYWPIPDGISYNSYLIQDDKNALIDGVKEGFTEEYLSNVTGKTDIDDVDYMVINHMEPDHTGSFPELRRLNPDLTFVCTEKAKDLLGNFYGITKGIKTVEDGETLDLGERTLEFVETPFVHWPETMMTYLQGESILFSGDGFGTYGALDGGIFDGGLDLAAYEDRALRYLSNIVGAYSTTLQAAINKLDSYDLEVIAPTHGPIWRENPEAIVNFYDRFSRGEARKGVTIIYGSMYGFTEKLTEQVALGARRSGIENLKVMDAARKHPSYLLLEAWKREGLIIGSPTYESRAFPPVSNFLELMEKKKLKEKTAAAYGSFGWGGGSAREIKETGESLNWNLVRPPLEFGGDPSERELEEGFELGKEVGNTVLE